jgi:hypothetical protein
MIPPTLDRPYLAAWLRRTGRQFAESGRLTETAMVLALTEGGSVDEWRRRLRLFLEGGECPSLDLLTKIDLFLAGSKKIKQASVSQTEFF